MGYHEGLNLQNEVFIMSNIKFVPDDVVDSMLSMLDDKDFFKPPRTKIELNKWILDHRCLVVSESQEAEFSSILMKRFNECLSGIIPDDGQRKHFIMQYLLFVTCDSFECGFAIRDKLYNDVSMLYNVYDFDIVNEPQCASLAISYRKELLNMKFGLVIGNPPYNNDMYIDFVIRLYFSKVT